MSLLNNLTQKLQNVTHHEEIKGGGGRTGGRANSLTLHGVEEEERCHGAACRIHLTPIKTSPFTSTWAKRWKQLERRRLCDQIHLVCAAKLWVMTVRRTTSLELTANNLLRI